jgi:type I restriction enzyme S subunit
MEVKFGYKDSEVGIIPEKWEVRRLASVLEQPRSVRYGIIQPGKFDPRGSLMLRSQDYSKGWAGPDEMHRVNSQLEQQYRNARIRSDDLIMTVVGAGIGQVVIVPAWLDGAILSRSTARIAVDESQASRAFVKASLESPVGKRQILNCQKEGAQPVVSCQDLAKFFIPYPPLSEQRAIAETLSDLDKLLDGLDRLMAKKRDLKQAAMQQLLTGQIRLPSFHGEWEVKKLSQLADIRSGGTPSTSVPQFWDGDIAWCTPTDITALNGHKYLVETARTITTQGIKSSSAEMIPPHSIVMTSRATIGECAINTVPISTNQGFKNFVPFESTDVGFLYYLLQTQKQGFISLCGGSTFLEIGKTQLSAYEVCLPKTKDEQTAIAEVLSDMDAELWALEQRQEKTRALKQAMMQELLTGKTRLV